MLKIPAFCLQARIFCCALKFPEKSITGFCIYNTGGSPVETGLKPDCKPDFFLYDFNFKIVNHPFFFFLSSNDFGSWIHYSYLAFFAIKNNHFDCPKSHLEELSILILYFNVLIVDFMIELIETNLVPLLSPLVCCSSYPPLLTLLTVNVLMLSSLVQKFTEFCMTHHLSLKLWANDPNFFRKIWNWTGPKMLSLWCISPWFGVMFGFSCCNGIRWLGFS